jgi:hypothetical protein
MAKEQDNKFWPIVDKINWGSRGIDDLEDCQKILKDLLSIEEIKQMDDWYDDKRKKLCRKLEKHAKEKCGNKHGYYPVSDDGYWDLTAHIVGLGEAVYKENLKNPELAKTRATKRDYQENFGYCFHLEE